jgi:hypothetical protein
LARTAALSHYRNLVTRTGQTRIDAMRVKIPDGQVANRPIYTAIGVTVDGQREIVGLWAGQGGEGASPGFPCSP